MDAIDRIVVLLAETRARGPPVCPGRGRKRCERVPRRQRLPQDRRAGSITCRSITCPSWRPHAAWRSQVIPRPCAATSQATEARGTNAGPSCGLVGGLFVGPFLVGALETGVRHRCACLPSLRRPPAPCGRPHRWPAPPGLARAPGTRRSGHRPRTLQISAPVRQISLSSQFGGLQPGLPRARWAPSAHPALGPRSRSAAPAPSGRTLQFSCYRFRPFESSCRSPPARQPRPLDSAPGESHPLSLPCGLRSTRQGLLERLSASRAGTRSCLRWG